MPQPTKTKTVGVSMWDFLHNRAVNVQVEALRKGKYLAVTPEVRSDGTPTGNGFKVTHVHTGFSVLPATLDHSDAVKLYRGLSRIRDLQSLKTPPKPNSRRSAKLLKQVRAVVARLKMGQLV